MGIGSSEEIFQALWEKVSTKASEGSRYILMKSKTDLEYIYCKGLVDEKRFTCEEWIDSFSESRRPDGSYRVSKDQWMEKIRFHYSGPVGVPFDPLQLREGDWSEDEVRALIREKILPSIFFTPEEFEKILEGAKKKGFFMGEKYRMTRAYKVDLLELLNRYPSPSRARELDQAVALRGRLPSSIQGEMGANLKSGFVKGGSPEKRRSEQLSQLLFKR